MYYDTFETYTNNFTKFMKMVYDETDDSSTNDNNSFKNIPNKCLYLAYDYTQCIINWCVDKKCINISDLPNRTK